LQTIPGRRALLLGVPDAEHLSKLAMVSNDIALMRSALTHSKYAIEVAGLSPETRLTRTSFLRKLSQFAKSGREGDTLILYYSGHGLHYRGIDYIVPYDAVFDTPEILPEFLVPVDFQGLFSDCYADFVLIVIDACREGIDLALYPDAKAASLVAWSEGRIASSRRKMVTYIFSCAAGEYSRYIDGPEGFSVFTGALATVLGPDHPACTLSEIEEALQEQVDIVSKQYSKAKQTIRIRSERGGSGSSAQTCLICDKSRLPGDPSVETGWKNTATNSPLWDLAQDCRSEEVKRSLKDRVGALAATAQGLAARTMSESIANVWIDRMFPLRCLSRVEFFCRETSSTFKPTVAEVALIIGTIFCHNAIRSAAILSSKTAVSPIASESHLSPTKKDLAINGSFHAFINKFSYILSATGHEDGAQGSRRSHAILWFALKWICNTPDFWHNGPGSFVTDEHWNEIFPENDRLIPSTVLDRTVLLQLSRHLAVAPAPDYQQSFAELSVVRTHFPSTLSEQSVRERLILYLLSVSSLMAIDIAVLSDVIAENILVDDHVSPSELISTIASSVWSPVDKDRALQASCLHPAVDQALRQHVQAADRVLQIVLEKALDNEDRFESLTNLPNKFRPTGYCRCRN
jgi:Caspase domain